MTEPTPARVFTSLEALLESVAWRTPEGLSAIRLTVAGQSFYLFAATKHQAMKSACQMEECTTAEAWDAVHRWHDARTEM